MYDLKFCQLGLAGVRSDSRGFAADLPVVPLFAVGEIFLVRAFNLLHGTNIRSETEQTSESESSAHVHTHTQPKTGSRSWNQGLDRPTLYHEYRPDIWPGNRQKSSSISLTSPCLAFFTLLIFSDRHLSLLVSLKDKIQTENRWFFKSGSHLL